MYVKTNLILQSLLLSWWPDSNGPSDVSNDLTFGEKAAIDDRPFRPRITPIPDPGQIAEMARFIAHVSNWTSLAYISHQKGTKGQALADMVAVSDGPVNLGSGIPYFYVSRLQAAVTDILDNGHICSLTMSLAQTTLCTERGWDAEDPRCAHLVFTGTFDIVDPSSAEYSIARDSLYARHPSFKNLPPSHHFFVAKYNIATITLQDNFGGPSDVSVADYFAVSNGKLGLVSRWYDDPYALCNGIFC